MRLFPLFVFLGIALLLAFVLLNQIDRRGIPDSGAADAALPALTLKPVDGRKAWDQAALKGHVSVINFFASWCTPCALEMPELAALKKQYPNLHLIGVVWNDDPKAVHAFLKKHGDPFDALWMDTTGDATMALGIKGIPESFVIGADGDIRYRLAQPLSEDLRHGSFGKLIAGLQEEAGNGK